MSGRVGTGWHVIIEPEGRGHDMAESHALARPYPNLVPYRATKPCSMSGECAPWLAHAILYSNPQLLDRADDNDSSDRRRERPFLGPGRQSGLLADRPHHAAGHARRLRLATRHIHTRRLST